MQSTQHQYNTSQTVGTIAGEKRKAHETLMTDGADAPGTVYGPSIEQPNTQGHIEALGQEINEQGVADDVADNFMMTQVDVQDPLRARVSQTQQAKRSERRQILAFISEERASGYPQPHLYDQHYINKYAYPKGLKCSGPRFDRMHVAKKSLYDMHVPYTRKGFSGWKLTKRPQELGDH